MLRNRGWITIAAVVGTFAGTAGWSAPDLSPRWAFEGVHINPNESFLSNQGFREDQFNPLDRLLDHAQQRDMRLRYEVMSRKWETRRNYGLYTPTHEQAEMDEVSSYGSDLKSSMRGYQLKQGRQKIEEVAYNDEHISKLKGPIAIILGIMAVYNGEPIKMDVAEETHLQAKTDKGKSALFNVSSPIVDTTFEMATTAPTASTTFEDLPPDPANRPERYKFGVSKGLGVLDLTTSVVYGSTTSSVMTTLAKPITANTTCFLDEVTPLSPSTSNVREPEVRVRVAYGLTF